MSFQENQLFEYEHLNGCNPLPRLLEDVLGEPLTGFPAQELLTGQFFRWIFTGC